MQRKLHEPLKNLISQLTKTKALSFSLKFHLKENKYCTFSKQGFQCSTETVILSGWSTLFHSLNLPCLMFLIGLVKHQLYTSASEALLLGLIEVNRILTEDISVHLSRFRVKRSPQRCGVRQKGSLVGQNQTGSHTA